MDPHRRSAPLPPASPNTPNYLELESDYIGDLSYDADVPVPLADYKHLQYPLAAEVFCGYRPTIVEFQSFLQLVSVLDTGPLVDLIDPVPAYPVCVPPSPAPEDAALLVGLIPGVERHLTPGEEETHRVISCSSSPVNVLNGKDAISLICDQFKIETYIHPLKSNLKPVKVRMKSSKFSINHNDDHYDLNDTACFILDV